jgi:hypothetical protein
VTVEERAMTGRVALVPGETPSAALIRRAAAIEACSRIAHAALRELRIALGNAPPAAWVDLPQEERDRQVLRAELLLSGGVVAKVERFLGAVLRAAAVELELRSVDLQVERLERSGEVGAVLHATDAQAERRRKVTAEHDADELALVEHIVRATAEDFRTTVQALVGNGREGRRATARSLAMLIASDNFCASFKMIGRVFGGRHRSTVWSNVRHMRGRVESDEKLRAAHGRICDVLDRSRRGVKDS